MNQGKKSHNSCPYRYNFKISP